MNSKKRIFEFQRQEFANPWLTIGSRSVFVDDIFEEIARLLEKSFHFAC